MSIHGFLDKAVVRIGSLFGLKYFGESVEGRSIKEHIDNIELEIPDFDGTGEYPVIAHALIGQVKTFFKVTGWKGLAYPVIIFQHGSGDQPYYERINRILPPGNNPAEANIIAISAPFNETKKDYIEAVKYLDRFSLIFALSTVLMEELVQYLKRNGSGKILISGISLGGWSTNLHHAFYNTADEYRPLLAGAAPDDLFINSYYRHMLAKSAQGHSELIKKTLNFEEAFARRPAGNVYPLLAVDDQYIVFERQKSCYNPDQITSIAKGHVTATAAGKELQKHLIRGLEE